MLPVRVKIGHRRHELVNAVAEQTQKFDGLDPGLGRVQDEDVVGRRVRKSGRESVLADVNSTRTVGRLQLNLEKCYSVIFVGLKIIAKFN